MSKILIVSDISSKQTNGVKTTLKNTIINLISFGHDVIHINQDLKLFKSISVPFYKEIELVTNPFKIKNLINDIKPDYIHISTEGPLGIAAKLYCDKMGYNYTTAIHTNFNDFLWKMFKFPKFISNMYMRWFHKKSKRIMVPTKGILNKYRNLGFKNLVVWGRGVDTNLFNGNKRTRKNEDNKIILLSVGRISKEKNIEEFLDLKLSFNNLKMVVGDGPELENLKKKYDGNSNIMFYGSAYGEDLAGLYANADIFVFNSKVDTYGVVLLEAIASGLPVAAYNEPGPKEIIINGVNGYRSNNLKQNIINCLSLLNKRKDIIKTSENFSWISCTNIFFNNLVKI